ncbi:hypothetical protein [Noviherbaspirillum soli]|uniref:hypothetical protein n=1 Tax=Noviherbaspirillum soli TaxID=1064518 RepID=UPI001889D57B|nr:hypothetical protein [Noviherbaspirillum soli]
MSVSFAPARNAAPAYHSQETSRNDAQHETVDSPSASCTWSFCSGQDRDLPLSKDEDINLINLRDVNFKYGSQGIDSEPDPEEGWQPCEISALTAAKVHGVRNAVTGLVAAAGIVTVNAVVCSNLSKDPLGANPCTFLALASLPAVAGAFGLTAMGVKQLVAAYQGRNNAHDDPNA